MFNFLRLRAWGFSWNNTQATKSFDKAMSRASYCGDAKTDFFFPEFSKQGRAAQPGGQGRAGAGQGQGRAEGGGRRQSAVGRF